MAGAPQVAACLNCSLEITSRYISSVNSLIGRSQHEFVDIRYVVGKHGDIATAGKDCAHTHTHKLDNHSSHDALCLWKVLAQVSVDICSSVSLLSSSDV